jgi:ribonuclease HI
MTSLDIYTDGACTANGTDRAKAAIGVYVDNPSLRHKNRSELLDRPPFTNQRAELAALLAGLEVVRNFPLTPPKTYRIFSDSKYALDCATRYLKSWKQNGFKTSSGGEVKNLDLIIDIDTVLQTLNKDEIKVELEWVKGHAGNTGNVRADKLATEALKQSQSRKRKKSDSGQAPTPVVEPEVEASFEESSAFLNIKFGGVVQCALELKHCFAFSGSQYRQVVRGEIPKLSIATDNFVIEHLDSKRLKISVANNQGPDEQKLWVQFPADWFLFAFDELAAHVDEHAED